MATAAVREAANGDDVAAAIGDAAGVPVEILSDEEEGRLSFIGATKTLGHPVEGRVGVVDVGGGSTEVILGTVPGGAARGPLLEGRLGRARRRADRLRPALGGRDPQGPRPNRRHLRGGRDRAPRAGGGRWRQRHLAASAGRRGARVRDPGAGRSGALRRPGRRRSPGASSSTRERVRILATGVLLLEKVSELLGQPLQIGKGGLREGVILDLLNGSANGSSPAASPPRSRSSPGHRPRRSSSLGAWPVRARSASSATEPFALAAARGRRACAPKRSSRTPAASSTSTRSSRARHARRHPPPARGTRGLRPCLSPQAPAQGAEPGQGTGRRARRAPRRATSRSSSLECFAVRCGARIPMTGTACGRRGEPGADRGCAEEQRRANRGTGAPRQAEAAGGAAQALAKLEKEARR